MGIAVTAAAVAADVLSRYGVAFDRVHENTGFTNASWIGEGLAIRVAPVDGVPQWSREVRLAQALPATVGYPAVVGHGVTGGHEWLVTELIDAVNLERVWPTLTTEQRVRAMRQAWARVSAVHATDPGDLVPRESKFYPPSAEPTREGLARLNRLGHVKTEHLSALNDLLDRHWAARETATDVLCHGDFWPCNALWDGTDVVSVLDFELALAAPIQVDVNELVKFGYGPPETPEDDPGPQMRDTVAELAALALRTPTDVDLLLGFSVQLEVWVGQVQLVEPWSDRPASQWQCFGMLAALAERPGGAYAQLLHRLGFNRW